ncbi:MAG: hypothetical protein H5U08_03065 [Thermogutta sp.]|nr:hypothetical protein [Thermogutta sp.]MBC7351314.1 hypothetical protein [Thermogutta sp.]
MWSERNDCDDFIENGTGVYPCPLGIDPAASLKDNPPPGNNCNLATE